MKLEGQSNAPHYVRDTFMKHFELWCIQWMPSRLHVLCGWQGDWERKSHGVSLLWLWVYNI